MATVIRGFETEDIGFALTQTSREGWDNTAPIFRVILEHDPDGCFVAEIDGEPAGMITTTRYSRSAWVGNLIVVPERRRLGLGERLMGHAIGHLEGRGASSLWLEADPMGIGIYRRLGFEDHYESPRFEKRPPHAARSGRCEDLRRSDLAEVRELDAVHFGDDRFRLLEGFLDVAPHACCIRRNGRLEGFAIALPSAQGIRVGPCVARNVAAGGELIDSVLARSPDQPAVVALAGESEEALSLLASRGFERGASCLRMLRGRSESARAPEGLVLMGNGGTG